MHALQAMAASTIRRLEALKVADLQQEARKMGVTDDALAEVEQQDDESMTVAQMKRCYVELIAMAPLEVELSISQRGGSSCVCIQARCLHEGGDDSDDADVISGHHHGVLWDQLSTFERVLTSVIDELWKGCSFTMSEGGNGIAEGVPPSLLRSTATPTSCLDELEPEPEPEPELQPEMEPEPKLAM
jgi:hypothetical protein